jgi:hypothetical protein
MGEGITHAYAGPPFEDFLLSVDSLNAKGPNGKL